MIQDCRAGIVGTIVVAHARVRPADKRRVAEDDPWLLGPGEKSLPENVKRDGHIRAVAGQPGLRGFAGQKTVRGDGYDGSQEDGEDEDGSEPPAGRLAIGWLSFSSFVRSSCMVASRARRPRMEGEDIVAFGHFDQDRVVRPLRGVVLREFGAQAPGLHADHGVEVRVKVLLAPKDFGRNLVLLWRGTRMLQGMIGEVAQELAKRLRAMERMAGKKFLDLDEIMGSLRHGDHRAAL